MTTLEQQGDLRRRWQLAALVFEAKLGLWRNRLALKYSDAQPRAPAGTPEGGQWTSGEGGQNLLVDAVGDVISELPTIVLAGGFGKDDMAKTVQEFVSENCKGKIRAELPGQFFDFTLEDLLAMKRSGDRAAQTCYKLLHENRFRKEK